MALNSEIKKPFVCIGFAVFSDFSVRKSSCLERSLGIRVNSNTEKVLQVHSRLSREESTHFEEYLQKLWNEKDLFFRKYSMNSFLSCLFRVQVVEEEWKSCRHILKHSGPHSKWTDSRQ